MSKSLFAIDIPKYKASSLFGSSGNSSKRKAIGKSLRGQVWIKHMGNRAQGKCYCCKIRSIHYTDFQVGHNKAVARGGKNNISNLRPICGTCNRGMRTSSIEAYRKKYYAKPTNKKEQSSKKKRRAGRPLNQSGFKPINFRF
jgi:5-methylcytosine-specific restriction endonuclease McrA